MLFSNWYFGMIFIILATAVYQGLWLKNHGYVNNQRSTILQKIGAWMLILIPIVNTLIGFMAMFILIMYVTKEELMIEVINSMDRFEKIK